MKPYQIKLRIVGVMSIILAVLAASIPLPSKAAIADDWRTYMNHVKYNEDRSAKIVSYRRDFADRSNITEIEITDDYEYDGVRMGRTEVETDFSSVRSGFFDESEKLEKITFAASNNGIVVSSGSFVNMFANCKALQEVIFVNGSVSTLGAENGTLESMFSDCTALVNVDLNGLYQCSPSNVTEMFLNCSSLEALDLSMMNLSGITDETAENMLTGCEALNTIITPINVPEKTTDGSEDIPVEIELPGIFKKEGTAGPYYTFLPTRGTGEKKVDANTSITLVRTNDATSVTISPEEIVDMEVGDTRMLTVKVEALVDADGTEVTFSLSDTDKLKFVGNGASSDGKTAEVRVNKSGEATVTIEALEVTAANTPVSVTAKALADPSLEETVEKNVLTDSIDVTVVAKRIEADGITVEPEEITVYTGTPVTVTATVSPQDASNHKVTWTTDASSIATVVESVTPQTDADGVTTSTTTITGVTPGKSTYITATTESGGYKARVKVTVESPYHLYAKKDQGKGDSTDNRTDTSNGKLTTASSDSQPLNHDLYLHLETVTEANSKMKSQMTSYNTVSYFTIEITDSDGDDGDDAYEDLGEDLGNVEITMALPGNMLATGQPVSVFRRNADGTASRIEDAVMTTVGDEGTIDAVRFTVGSTTLADEYALAMNRDTSPQPTQYVLETKDQRPASAIQGPSHVARTSNTVQTSDLYLFVKEIQTGTLKTTVESTAELNAYQTKHYYDIYLATDEAGNNRVTYDFKEVEVFLSLPADLDVYSGTYRLIREKAGTPGWEDVEYRKVFGLNNGYQYIAFKADHFSEYALLYNPENGGSGTDDGNNTNTPVINVNIPEINITIDAAGSISTSTGPGGSSGASGTSSGSGTDTNGNQGNNPGGSSTNNNNNTSGTGVVPGNSGDMPTTGGAHMYRVLIVILLALSGTVEVMLSIPARRRIRAT